MTPDPDASYAVVFYSNWGRGAESQRCLSDQGQCCWYRTSDLNPKHVMLIEDGIVYRLCIAPVLIIDTIKPVPFFQTCGEKPDSVR